MCQGYIDLSRQGEKMLIGFQRVLDALLLSSDTRLDNAHTMMMTMITAAPVALLLQVNLLMFLIK